MLSPDYTAFANGNEPRLGVRPATVFKQIDRLSVRRLFRIVACIGSNCRRLKSAGRSPEYTGDVWRLESPTNGCRIPRTSQGTELRCACRVECSESSAVQNHQRFRIISGSESSAIQNHQRFRIISDSESSAVRKSFVATTALRKMRRDVQHSDHTTLQPHPHCLF